MASEKVIDESIGEQSGGGTEDDPVGPVTTSDATTIAGGTISHKATAVDFLHKISADSAELEAEEWTDLTPIPAILLEPAPPAFPPSTAKAKSSSSALRCESVPCTLSTAEGQRGTCRSTMAGAPRAEGSRS